MKSQEGFSVAGRARSFGHAFRGLATLLASQHNSWIHAVATLAVLVFGFWLRVSASEWAILLLAVGAVWSAEAFNTALEALCDRLAPDHDPRVGTAKDVAAAAVLLAAGAAALAGLCIFLPKLLRLLTSS